MAKQVTAAGPVDGPWALPDGWRWRPLGDLGEFLNGAAFKPSDWGNAGTPIIRIQNLNNPDRAMNRTTRTVNERLMVRAGDLLVSWSATLDAFLWRREDAWLNQHIFKVIPDPRLVDRRFMFFLLKNEIENLKKTEHLHGSTMMHINRGPFLAHLVPVPPIETQVKVAARIDELFAELDDGEAALARARDDLATWRDALLKAAVTGELTADWRATNPPTETGADLLARILADRRTRWGADPKSKGKRYVEPATPDLETMPTLPESWAWTTADALTSADRNAIVIGPFGSDLKTTDYRDTGVPLVFVRHIRSENFSGLRPQFVDLDKAQKLAAHIVRSGDVLVTKMGDPPGDAAIYPSEMPEAIVTADCIRWRPSGVLPASFLVEWINSHAGRRWIASKTKGVAQQKITLALFRSMPVPIAPANEVATINIELKRLRSGLGDLADAESDCAALSPILRQSILAAAFRGDLA